LTIPEYFSVSYSGTISRQEPLAVSSERYSRPVIPLNTLCSPHVYCSVETYPAMILAAPADSGKVPADIAENPCRREAILSLSELRPGPPLSTAVSSAIEPKT
jgi:hypothetical protein